MSNEITKEDSRWSGLYRAWINDRKPAQVVERSGTFTAQKRGDTDDSVVFVPRVSGVDAGYESTSKLGRLGG